MNQRKLDKWCEAGLIDEATASNILAYEDAHSRPLAVWAVVGIGALAIGLGLISLIAANWEDVPGLVRLAIHLVLMIALGGWLAFGAGKHRAYRPFIMEVGLFALALLGLTFFGHIGQVYQTDSPLWKPIAAWLALFAPLLLLRGKSWLIALLLFAGFAGLCWEYASYLPGMYHFDGETSPPSLLFALITTLPVVVAAPAAWLRMRGDRENFWKRLEQVAIIYAVGGASLSLVFASTVGAGIESERILAPSAMMLRGGIALLAALGVVLVRRNVSGQMGGAIFAGAGVAAALAPMVAGSQLMAGLVFMLLWTGIGAAALRAGWRGVFQLAVAAVAIRLIILSFELATDLLTSGFGLIVSGLMILGVAWVAVKVSREYAPVAEEETA